MHLSIHHHRIKHAVFNSELQVVRNFAFPDHKISYIGRTAYRAILPTKDILSIPDFPDAVTFWHGPTDWVYTCNLNGGNYEITVNAVEPTDASRVSWGEKATLEEFRRPWKVSSLFNFGKHGD